ncbi:putative membrane protein [hydrothermal vent metagenome]|uniref:Putative membrane protein n=1 Tax=hydrothermal vent metagenome TaxID=652676 RepID=A0A3B0W0N4_9ZZZZ
MPLTISELEAERAKILEEIENKAQDFSGDSTIKPEQPSLKSWLNAAEEVMPASKAEKNMRTTSKKTSNYQSQVFKPSKNKVPFFGVLIVLTLLLTILGVIYIAYSSIHKELQSVLESHEQSVKQMKKIQMDMNSLQKTIATGGKVELFISLEDKIFALEAQVLALKTQVNNMKTVESPTIEPVAPLDLESSGIAPKILEHQLVTKSVLDESLKRYTEKLEARIDQKLETILSYLAQQGPAPRKEKEGNVFLKPSNNQPLSNDVTDQPKAAITTTPKISDVKKPVIQQPLVQFIKPIESPKSPKKVNAPIKHYSSDVKWLMGEPAMHYILQLASMPEANSLKNMVSKKQLQNTRIVPQVRNGVVSYILVTGSFSDRKKANELSKQIKAEFGISPWVRKIKDISIKVE